jgi:hypothetical protein
MMETNFAVSLAEQQVKGEVDRNRLEIDDDDHYHTLSLHYRLDSS